MSKEVEELKKDLTKALRSFDEIKSRSDGIGELQGTIEKLKGEIAEKSQAISDIETKNIAEKKAQDERIKDLELQLSSGYAQKSDDDVDLEEKSMEELSEILAHAKTGVELKEWNEKAENLMTKNMSEDRKADVKHLIRKSLTVGNDGSGGILLAPSQIRLMSERAFDTSPIRTYASTFNIAESSLKFIIDDDEASANWVGEVGSRDKTDNPDVGEIEVVAHEMFAKPQATQNFLDDAAVDASAWLIGKIGRRFIRLENTAFVSGDGSKKPKGFLSYGNANGGTTLADAKAYQRGALGTLQSENAASITGDDLINLKRTLKDDYSPNSRWYMNRSTWAEIMSLQDANGAYLFDRNMLLSQDTSLQILGKPVVIAEDMPDIGAGAIPVVYGDMAETYAIVDRKDVTVLRDPYSNKPFIQFYTTKRVGGDVVSYDALKRLIIQ